MKDTQLNIPKTYFLDAFAHQPPSAETLGRFWNIHSQNLGHPSGITASSRKAAQIIEESRAQIAELIGAKNPNQIFFEHNCTSAAEHAFQILSEKYLSGSFICSLMEHNAVRDPFSKMETTEKRFTTKFNIDPADLNPSDCLIVPHLQNELGIINNIKYLGSSCNFLFSDMSQSLGKIPVNVSESYVDMAIFGAHKFGGLDLGILYIRDPKLWIPFGTGSRYFQDRPGTPSVASIGASAFALAEAIKSLPERAQRAASFQKIFEAGLPSLGAEVIGSEFNRSAHATFLCHPDKAVTNLMELSENNVFVGLGSACGSMATGVSPTLTALDPKYKNFLHTDFMRVSQWGNYDDRDATFILNLMEKISK